MLVRDIPDPLCLQQHQLFLHRYHMTWISNLQLSATPANHHQLYPDHRVVVIHMGLTLDEMKMKSHLGLLQPGLSHCGNPSPDWHAHHPIPNHSLDQEKVHLKDDSR
jgi:hypothetical protein